MSFIHWEKTENRCFENYTLILPAIAVGNVGQLAVDLLLNNTKVDNIAHLHHSCFLPFAGADPFDPKNKKLTTSCQMYECKERKLVTIQNRTPLIKNKVGDYINFLVNFIKENKIKRTIMLSSSFSQFFTHEQLQNVPMHYLFTEKFEQEHLFQTLSWKKFVLPVPDTSAIPGGGISEAFFHVCDKEKIPLVILIMVCSEGDNYFEANQMISNLNKWLQIKEVDKWAQPFSWNFPYANDAPHVLY